MSSDSSSRKSSGPTIIQDTPQVKVFNNNKPSIAPRPLYSSMKGGRTYIGSVSSNAETGRKQQWENYN